VLCAERADAWRAGGRKPFRPQLRREQVWLDYWTYARTRLGLTDREFRAYTPRQLDALRKAHLQHSEDTEFLFGQLTAAVVNFSQRRPAESARPGDFMPSQIRKKAAARLVDVEMTDEVREKIAKKLRKQMDRVFSVFER
jgi:hypothetical protein